MAFTDTEIQEIRSEIVVDPTHQGLFKLGLMYSTDIEGQGPDYVEAHKWFNLAAMMGSEPAKAYRGELTLEMTRKDLSLAQRAARGWLLEQNSQASQSEDAVETEKAAA